MSSSAVQPSRLGPGSTALLGVLLLVGGAWLLAGDEQSPVSEAARASGAFDQQQVAEVPALGPTGSTIATFTSLEVADDETPPPEPGPTTTTTTTTTSAPAGFSSPAAAMHSHFGYPDQPAIHCNSGDAGASNPCWDTFAGAVHLFRPSWDDWHWVLIDEVADGVFVVAETVAMEGEYDFPNSPWP